MKKMIVFLIISSLILSPLPTLAEEGLSEENIKGHEQVENTVTENKVEDKEVLDIQSDESVDEIVEKPKESELINGWIYDEKSEHWYYYIDNEKSKGWIVVEEEYYYLDMLLGERKTGWQKIDNMWYFLNGESGVRESGWIHDQNKWYFLNNEGIMQTGWIKDEDKWYYLSNSGAMQVGWLKDNGKWYYLNKSGAMLSGWIYDNGRWYLLYDHGAMATGWAKVQSKWYYLSTSGAMLTGWIKDNGKWYYLNKSGAMLTGWILDSNKWYYLRNSGEMTIGWFKVDSKWYYTYVNGSMARNKTIDGYYVGNSGKWLPDLVNPKQTYTYEQMIKDIDQLKSWYPDIIHTEVIGNSVDGREIIAVKLGKGEKEIFLNGSHHAREHITTNLLMEMMDEYTKAFEDNVLFSGYNTKELLSQTSIWFVPMVNPDGVTLVQKGHTSAKNPNYVLQLNNYSTDFSEWKANIRGVDLNRQYPAGWDSITGNTGKPSSSNFKGYQPLSEPEVKAIYNFTKGHNFKTAVAYHSSGEILYWHYKQTGSEYSRDYQLALKYSNLTGYSLVSPSSNPSGGGFKDWFIQEMKQPGFTPEVSPYTYGKPVPISNFDKIWAQNKAIGLMLAKDAQSR